MDGCCGVGFYPLMKVLNILPGSWRLTVYILSAKTCLRDFHPFHFCNLNPTSHTITNIFWRVPVSGLLVFQ